MFEKRRFLQRFIETRSFRFDQDCSNSLRGKSNSLARTLKQSLEFDLFPVVVIQVQPKLESIDSFGVRYLSAIRNLSSPLLSTNDDETRQVPFRDILFAYYSNDQQSLLDETIEVIGKGKLSWEQARSVGIPLWLRDRDLLVRGFIHSLLTISRERVTQTDLLGSCCL